ncbi:thiamine-phosphate kinase [Pseudomonas sp. P66]|jgi:thiamine-monophosphate kinase|uniref:Thiamine-monophosphate kinase n=1 Tax=Pseudomonas arcuscaelestis TaxID=2710591 RepID=A0ABS2BWN8_9PSED|nr:thiamine-phosphate kinase [Pseudomonas arcuscaelestis]MBM3107172.1 thiamine-phosphate kinase [Pseudomonas arcuscaelestis]MBM3111809.1 thiamine-phosphate kinase [Pseudomonas arcuscaelestis]MBM5458034.1 thiamine-phosphate kinase [Pseudomonas arcuscaelestis]
MGEFELIRHFFAAAPCAQGGEAVALGIGDDCALLSLAPGEQVAISTDTLVAGVHFPAVCDPFLLGQRSLAVAASDLAAMGARPIGFTLALTLPEVRADWLQAYAHGLNQMAQACQLSLIGGDTTRGPLSLTMTVFGRVPAGLALTRSGARAGDLLCVGGELGNAAGALPLVLGEQQADSALADPLLAHYWSPQPQFALGQALRGKATSALDISDGLLADCGHIAKASQVSVQVQLSRLPISAALQTFLGHQGALQAALTGGDDYVLAFTLPEVEVAPLLEAGWPIHVVGRVGTGTGVSLVDDQGKDITPTTRGYQHFREQP